MEFVKLFQPFLIASTLGSLGLLTLMHIAEKPIRGLLFFLIAFYLFPSSMGMTSLSWWIYIAILFITLVGAYTRELTFPLKDRKFPRIALSSLIIIFLFLTSIIISSWNQLGDPIFWSLSKDAEAFVARSYYFAFITGFMIIFTVPIILRTEEQFNVFMKLFFILGLIIAIWGISEQITGIEFFADLRGGLVSQPIRLSTLPNGSVTSCAIFLLVPGLIGAYKLVYDKESRSFLLTFTTLIILTALVWTFARAAFIGAFISFGILALVAPISIRLKTIFIMIGIIAIIMVYLLGFRFPTSNDTLLANPYLSWMLVDTDIERREDTTFNPIDATDLYGRLGRWELALATMNDSPIIGFGLGTNVRQVNIRRSIGIAGGQGSMFSSNHNSYIDIGIDLGIVGVSILWLMILWTFKNFITAFSEAKKNNFTSLKFNSMILSLILPAIIVTYSFNSDRGVPFIFLAFALSISLLNITKENSLNNAQL